VKEGVIMARRKYYYNLHEAEELKQTFSSWINKVAHIGNGQISILKEIKIRPKRTLFKQDPASQVYHVEFQFINAKKIDASHFLITNGLTNIISRKSPLEIAFKNGPIST
jgi:hypothetical protein